MRRMAITLVAAGLMAAPAAAWTAQDLQQQEYQRRMMEMEHRQRQLQNELDAQRRQEESRRRMENAYRHNRSIMPGRLQWERR